MPAPIPSPSAPPPSAPPGASTSSPFPPPLLLTHPMPLPPPPHHDPNNSSARTSYDKLLNHLHPTPPKPLDLAILPSSSGSEGIQYCSTEHALGIPHRFLIAAFLVARKLFFAHLSPSSALGHGSVAAAEEGKDEGEGDKWKGEEEEILDATSVILLHDGNHLTAINFRKRYILRRRPLPHSSSSSSTSPSSTPNNHAEKDTDIITRELLYLQSLLTSPLPKHTKSPPLWSHRLWLLRSFVVPELRLEGRTAGGGGGGGGGECGGHGEEGGWRRRRLRLLVEREMGVVMRAGERHARNYYGWEYGRGVCGLVLLDMDLDDGGEVGEGWGDLMSEMVRRVRRWCFLHPRDVSGWSFLVWLLEDRMGVLGCVGGREDMVKETVMETEAFVAKYQWRGESIDWFLKAVRRLQTSE